VRQLKSDADDHWVRVRIDDDEPEIIVGAKVRILKDPTDPAFWSLSLAEPEQLQQSTNVICGQEIQLLVEAFDIHGNR